MNVDAAARTSAQEIEVGSAGEEKELFLASQVSNIDKVPVGAGSSALPGFLDIFGHIFKIPSEFPMIWSISSYIS